MRFPSMVRRERRGFSLIELLVVISIIGILVALTAAAVIPVVNRGPKLQVVNEIRQLEVALNSFKNDFGIYPPSRLFLSNNAADYLSAKQGSLQWETYTYLQRIWPRIDVTRIDWGEIISGPPPTKLPQPPPPVILQGDQCLVFFLGGMQSSATGSNSCLGFSTDPYNPTALPKTQGELRKGPYLNFDSARLAGPNAIGAPTLTVRGPPFSPFAYVYMDIYGAMPYAYFSTPKGTNRYNLDILTKALPVPGDCPSLTVAPYMKNASPPIVFYNPDTFQIISAGKDLVFGSATTVAPGTPAPSTLTTYKGSDQVLRNGSGADDLSNFAGDQLGAGL